MRAPICEICLKSEMLCQGCLDRVESEEISEFDVEVSRVLYSMRDRFRSADEIEFKKAVESGNLLVLIVGKGNVGALIGKGGKIVRLLSRTFRKKIRIIENTGDPRRLANDLLLPARVRGINVVYRPDKEEMHRIKIGRGDGRLLPSAKQDLEHLLSSLTGKEIEIAASE